MVLFLLGHHLIDKAEALTKILDFLEEVFPTADSKPDYVCAALCITVAGHHWDVWKDTTRIIVDAYHYNNHKITDVLCRTYCNPAPDDGSAPNLLVVKNGPNSPYLQYAYNTQVCEQLNTWIGGYESILNRLTVYNFKLATLFLCCLFIYKEKLKFKSIRGKEVMFATT